MTKRKHKSTSKAAHDSIKPLKNYYQDKVIEGLTKLKVGGTYEEIAQSVKLKPDQVWKRISELVEKKKVYDTGITRTLSSRRKGTVWQLVGLETSEEAPVIQKENKKPKPVLSNNQKPLFSL